VENAFEHGLQPKEGSWQVEIRVKTIRSHMVISIKDNGIGVDRKRLCMLRAELKEGIALKPDRPDKDKEKPEIRKGIGLQNVDSRLKLHFGGKASLRFFSKPEAGSLIVLKLPLHNKEDSYE